MKYNQLWDAYQRVLKRNKILEKQIEKMGEVPKKMILPKKSLKIEEDKDGVGNK